MNKKYKFLIPFFSKVRVKPIFKPTFSCLICEPVLSETFLWVFSVHIKQGWYHKTSWYLGTIVCFC